MNFSATSRGIEYSQGLKKFIFWKYNVLAFKWRVERFSTTLKEKKAACLRKKGEKNHPEELFDWRVSILWIFKIYQNSQSQMQRTVEVQISIRDAPVKKLLRVFFSPFFRKQAVFFF